MRYSSEAPVRFQVEAATGAYDVSIGAGLIESLLAGGGDRVFIVDEVLAAPFIDAGVDPIVIVAEEPAKSLDRMPAIVEQLRERGANRRTTLVAVGGGIVQDIAAFVASVYMRGLNWVYAPSTLLSMTDSCIGGKSSINVGRFKNIVGTFHPPEEVVLDPDFIATLDIEQRAAGLCEAVKIALCRGVGALDTYLALAPAPGSSPLALAPVIEGSLRAKKWFIEIDEFDQNERLLLNFGHTFGHAIEAATGFAVGHGIAVGLGMMAALDLGEAMGRDYSATPAIGRFRAHVDGLIRAPGTTAAGLANADTDRLMAAFATDKKHARDQFAVITVASDGTVERIALPRDAASTAVLAGTYDRLVARYTAPAA